MKTDSTTKVLLGVIATGVAALTALAFEKRYHNQFRPVEDELDDSTDHAYDRISRAAQLDRPAREEASSFKDRWEDGVENLREKAGQLKDRVSEGAERAGEHLREGAEKMRDGLKHAGADIKEGAEDAAEKAKRALGGSKM